MTIRNQQTYSLGKVYKSMVALGYPHQREAFYTLVHKNFKLDPSYTRLGKIKYVLRRKEVEDIKRFVWMYEFGDKEYPDD